MLERELLHKTYCFAVPVDYSNHTKLKVETKKDNDKGIIIYGFNTMNFAIKFSRHIKKICCELLELKTIEECTSFNTQFDNHSLIQEHKYPEGTINQRITYEIRIQSFVLQHIDKLGLIGKFNIRRETMKKDFWCFVIDLEYYQDWKEVKLLY
jgi:hypothetical protein